MSTSNLHSFIEPPLTGTDKKLIFNFSTKLYDPGYRILINSTTLALTSPEPTMFKGLYCLETYFKARINDAKPA